jgi:hypothetical protein
MKEDLGRDCKVQFQISQKGHQHCEQRSARNNHGNEAASTVSCLCKDRHYEPTLKHESTLKPRMSSTRRVKHLNSRHMSVYVARISESHRERALHGPAQLADVQQQRRRGEAQPQARGEELQLVAAAADQDLAEELAEQLRALLPVAQRNTGEWGCLRIERKVWLERANLRSCVSKGTERSL